ncbi:MAG: N-acetyltransferase [Aquificaceae bacterium]|nr:MAG: N-acetyltransferase [Aquificaceae bacterium]
MNIRLANIDDQEALVDIYNQAITAGQKTADTEWVTLESRRAWFDDHPAEQYPLLVAEIDHVIAGYLTISGYRTGRLALRYTGEVSYYIHFDYHRQGVGSSLMEHAIALCPSIQIKTLIAILMDCNQGSIGLLKKYGFKEWGHMPKIADYDGLEVGQLYYGLRVDD